MSVPQKPDFSSRTNAPVPSSLLSALADVAAYATKPPACAITLTGTQSIPTGVFTAITFNTELVDTTGSMFAPSSTNLVIPETGIYVASAVASIAPNATGNRWLGINQNGSSVVIDVRGAMPTDFCAMSCTTMLVCTAGDILTMSVYQSSGGALNASSCRFTVAWQSAT